MLGTILDNGRHTQHTQGNSFSSIGMVRTIYFLERNRESRTNATMHGSYRRRETGFRSRAVRKRTMRTSDGMHRPTTTCKGTHGTTHFSLFSSLPTWLQSERREDLWGFWTDGLERSPYRDADWTCIRPCRSPPTTHATPLSTHRADE